MGPIYLVKHNIVNPKKKYAEFVHFNNPSYGERVSHALPWIGA